MAAETELERLVVRLVGDGSEYQKMTSEAISSTQETAQQIEQYTKQIENFGQGIKDFAGNVMSVLVALGARRWLEQAFGEFDTMERTAIQLTATLEAQGRAVATLLPEYQDWAAEVQRMSEIGDDSVLSLIRQAEAFGQTGDAAKEAVKDAIALAKGNEGLANSMLRVTAAVAKGDIKRAMMFSRVIPELRGIKDAGEFQKKYNELVTAGWNATIRLADTATGQINQLKNAYGDLMEEFGAVVSEVIKPAIAGFKEVVRWFQELNPEIKRAIVFSAILAAALLSIGPAIAILKPLHGVLMKPFVGIQVQITKILGFVLGLLGPVQLVKTLWAGVAMVLTGISSILLAIINPLTVIKGLVGAVKLIVFGWYGSFATAIKWIAGIGAVILVVVESVGGFAGAWKIAQKAAEDAWQWIQPIREALTKLFKLIYDFGLAQFRKLGQAQLDVFNRLVRASGITWQGIQDAIVSAIDFVTDFLDNFGDRVGAIWDAIAEGASQAWGYVYSIISGVTAEYETFVKVIGGTAAAIAGAVVVYKALSALFILLKIQAIAQIALWVAWKAILLAVAVVVGVVAGAMLAWKAVMILVNFAVMALSAGITLLNVTLGLLTAAGLVVFLGLAAAALGAVYAAVVAVVEVFDSLVEVMSNIPNIEGPLNAVTGLFGEWLGAIKEIAAAFMVDMPMAMELAKMHFQLAIERLKSLWPPLWEFVKAGFAAVTRLVTSVFNVAWLGAIGQVMAHIANLSTEWNPIAKALGIGGIDQEALARQQEQIRKKIADFQERAKAELGAAAGKFKVEKSPEEIALEKDLEAARKRVALKKEEQDEFDQVAKDLREAERAGAVFGLSPEDVIKEQQRARRAGMDVGKAMSAGVKTGTGDMAAVLSGSSEALSRLAAYRDAQITQIASPRMLPGGGGPADEMDDAAEEQVVLLKDIRNILHKDANKQPIELAPVDFGAGIA